MADVSRLVSERIAITRTLTSAVTVHGNEVAAAIVKALFPDGAPPDFQVTVFLHALGALAQRSVDELSAANQAHATELADDGEPRATRDATKDELRARMIGIRSTLSGVYGATLLSAYGLSGETPSDAEHLIEAACTTERLLRNRPLTEAPKQEGVSVDRVALADSLKARVDALRTALGDVRREEREAQVTLQRRNAATAAWNGVYQGVADSLTGLFELAGKGELADRVRPTARRRAGLTEVEDTEGGGAGEG
ncbi:MAG TPA: hypothetical protein VM694_36255 [Polyangium sp.]|nr:hypothetical protein [Polyangium sp.]